MRVYIAGPIAGYPDGNRAAFAARAMTLRFEGHDPVNPHHVPAHSHAGPCPDGLPGGEGAEHTAPCYMRTDIMAMLGCDAIYLLPGWEKSQGARIEYLIAVHVCGLKLLNPEAVPPHLVVPKAVLEAFGTQDRTQRRTAVTRALMSAVDEHPAKDPTLGQMADRVLTALDALGGAA